MENFKKITKQQSPARTIAFGFAVLIFIGAALLSLPIAVRGAGQLPGLIDEKPDTSARRKPGRDSKAAGFCGV